MSKRNSYLLSYASRRKVFFFLFHYKSHECSNWSRVHFAWFPQRYIKTQIQISWIFKLMSFASVHYKKYTRRLIENFIWKIQQRLRVIIRFIRKCPVVMVTKLLRCAMLLSFQSIKFWSRRLCLSNVNNLRGTQNQDFSKKGNHKKSRQIRIEFYPEALMETP